MIAVFESLLEIFRSMPYGDQAVTFIKNAPPEIAIMGFILGFFATAASWGEVDKKCSGISRLLEGFYKVSGVVTGLTCLLLAGYIILTQQLMVLFYICTLILGSMFNVIFQFIIQAFGKVGYYISLIVGCISGIAVVLTVWLYANGNLLDFLTKGETLSRL